MNIHIRKATISDVDILIKLRFDFLLTLYDNLTKDEDILIREQLATYFINHINYDLLAIFAEIDNNISSTAFLVISEMPANLESINGKRGTLLNVFTYPKYRRMGLATKVIKQIITDAKQIGISAIDLDATQDGKLLYEKLGFIEPGFNHTTMKLNLG
jgi:ribosomal protein S18 acetylase RimI-like enzyme